MIFSNKQIKLILFVSLVVLLIACIYLGYSSVNEGFQTSNASNSIAPSTTPGITTIPNSTEPSTTAGITTIPNSTEPSTTAGMTTIPNSTEPSTTAGMTTIPNSTEPSTTSPSTTAGMTTVGNPSNITLASSLTVGGAIPSTTSPLTTNAMTTKPKLMDNGFKIPQTNLLQSDFNGTSNIYSPYLYVREPFQPISYDMDNYQHI